MSRPYDFVTFDCYGTLVDWDAGIADAFQAAASAERVTLDRGEVLAAYAEIEPIVESGGYRSYRDVLRETARRVAHRLGWDLGEERSDFLPRSMGDWQPFDDTVSALERLTDSGYRLGILSNVDVDLLAATVGKLQVDFDLLVTAQDVGSYKPSPAHFQAARERIGSVRWLHVAQSYFHDVRPALELGITVAWINRKGEELDVGAESPDREFRTLVELADWLA